MNPKVDWFFEKDTKWQKEYQKLRMIVLDCMLTEELKWGVPCYAFQGSNVVLIHGFKEYFALLFPKGVLLNDTNKILIQQTKFVQAARQIRLKSISEIEEMEALIKAYIYEAIEIERAGLKVVLKKSSDFEVVSEFRIKLDKDPALKSAFDALTPGRQRAYLIHFSQPKQAKTRESRVAKYIPQIMEGRGLND